MPKLNSVITIITHLEGAVYFFVFFALLSSTRLFKSLSPSTFVTFFESQIQCFCLYHLFVFFYCSKQNAFKKTSHIEQKTKEGITLQNLAGGKFMARRISFMTAKKTSNALQRLLNEL